MTFGEVLAKSGCGVWMGLGRMLVLGYSTTSIRVPAGSFLLPETGLNKGHRGVAQESLLGRCA